MFSEDTHFATKMFWAPIKNEDNFFHNLFLLMALRVRQSIVPKKYACSANYIEYYTLTRFHCTVASGGIRTHIVDTDLYTANHKLFHDIYDRSSNTLALFFN